MTATLDQEMPAEHEVASDVQLLIDGENLYMRFIEKKAPSNLVLVSGDRDYEALLADYERQGRKVAVCFYRPVGGGHP